MFFPEDATIAFWSAWSFRAFRSIDWSAAPGKPPYGRSGFPNVEIGICLFYAYTR
jgi:hypothetical protein